MAPPRQCSGCTECCRLLRIPQLAKPAGVPCPNCTGHSCSIYDNRPDICRRFRCMWLLNDAFGERDYWKPDACGIVSYIPNAEPVLYFVCADDRWTRDPWWTDIQMAARQMAERGIRTMVRVGETVVEVTT